MEKEKYPGNPEGTGNDANELYEELPRDVVDILMETHPLMGKSELEDGATVYRRRNRQSQTEEDYGIDWSGGASEETTIGRRTRRSSYSQDDPSQYTTRFQPVDPSAFQEEESYQGNDYGQSYDEYHEQTSAYPPQDTVSQQTSAYTPYDSVSQHTSAYTPYDSVSQQTSAYTPYDSVSQQTSAYTPYDSVSQQTSAYTPYDSVSQQTSAYTPYDSVSQQTSAYTPYDSVSQQTSAYTPYDSVSQHTSAYTDTKAQTEYTQSYGTKRRGPLMQEIEISIPSQQEASTDGRYERSSRKRSYSYDDIDLERGAKQLDLNELYSDDYEDEERITFRPGGKFGIILAVIAVLAIGILGFRCISLSGQLKDAKAIIAENEDISTRYESLQMEKLALEDELKALKAGDAPAEGGEATEGTTEGESTGDYEMYTVTSGDSTWWNLAQKFYGDGTKYTKILEANGLKESDYVREGQELKIPK